MTTATSAYSDNVALIHAAISALRDIKDASPFLNRVWDVYLRIRNIFGFPFGASEEEITFGVHLARFYCAGATHDLGEHTQDTVAQFLGAMKKPTVLDDADRVVLQGILMFMLDRPDEVRDLYNGLTQRKSDSLKQVLNELEALRPDLSDVVNTHAAIRSPSFMQTLTNLYFRVRRICNLPARKSVEEEVDIVWRFIRIHVEASATDRIFWTEVDIEEAACFFGKCTVPDGELHITRRGLIDVLSCMVRNPDQLRLAYNAVPPLGFVSDAVEASQHGASSPTCASSAEYRKVASEVTLNQRRLQFWIARYQQCLFVYAESPFTLVAYESASDVLMMFARRLLQLLGIQEDDTLLHVMTHFAEPEGISNSQCVKTIRDLQHICTSIPRRARRAQQVHTATLFLARRAPTQEVRNSSVQRVMQEMLLLDHLRFQRGYPRKLLCETDRAYELRFVDILLREKGASIWGAEALAEVKRALYALFTSNAAYRATYDGVLLEGIDSLLANVRSSGEQLVRWFSEAGQSSTLSLVPGLDDLPEEQNVEGDKEALTSFLQLLPSGEEVTIKCTHETVTVYTGGYQAAAFSGEPAEIVCSAQEWLRAMVEIMGQLLDSK